MNKKQEIQRPKEMARRDITEDQFFALPHNMGGY